MGRITYKMIYEQFLEVTKIDKNLIDDYRPCDEMYWPHCYIPGAIIVWLKDNSEIIYLYNKGE